MIYSGHFWKYTTNTTSLDHDREYYANIFFYL